MQWFNKKYRFYSVLAIGVCAVGALGFATMSPAVLSAGSDGPGSTDGVGDFHKSTMAGATGIVDEADIDKVIFEGGRAKLRNTLERGNVKLRYNICLDSAGSNFSVDQIWIGIRYKDNGSDARVTAKLKQYDFTTGAITTLMVWNSDDHGQAPGFQYIWKSEFGSSLAFIDSYDAYYLEVTLKKTAKTGKPEVAIVQSWVCEE